MIIKSEELKEIFKNIPKFQMIHKLKEFKKLGLKIKSAGEGVVITYQCKNRSRCHFLVYCIRDYNNQLQKVKKIMGCDLLKTETIFF